MVLCAQVQCIEGIHPSFLAELMAVRAGCLLADSNKWHTIIIDTNSSNVDQAINQPKSLALEVKIVERIRQFLWGHSHNAVSHCRRSANKEMHVLASFGLSNG